MNNVSRSLKFKQTKIGKNNRSDQKANSPSILNELNFVMKAIKAFSQWIQIEEQNLKYSYDVYDGRQPSFSHLLYYPPCYSQKKNKPNK